MLIREIEGMLADNGFGNCEYGGCFDKAGRKNKLQKSRKGSSTIEFLPK